MFRWKPKSPNRSRENSPELQTVMNKVIRSELGTSRQFQTAAIAGLLVLARQLWLMSGLIRNYATLPPGPNSVRSIGNF